MVVHAAGPVGGEGPQLGRVVGGVEHQLGDTGTQAPEEGVDGRSAAAGCVAEQVVGEHHALLGSQATEREAGEALERGRRHAHRQAELDGQLELHVEELRAQRQRAHVVVDVADVEAPQDRPLDLGPELAAGLVEVGVLPEVVGGAGESAVAVVERR